MATSDRTKANRLEFRIDTAFRVMRRPAGWVLKQSNRADLPVGAEIEPVQRPARHANEIAGLDFDCENGRIRRMNVEQPAALNDESDFVFVVPVFAAEFRKHDVQVRRLRLRPPVGADRVRAALVEGQKEDVGGRGRVRGEWHVPTPFTLVAAAPL